MIFELLRTILNTNLGSERGELLFTFLLTHTLITDIEPTQENTEILTAKDDAFKIEYLRNHFSNIEEIVKVIFTVIHEDDKNLLYPYLRQYIRLTGKNFSIWTYAPHKETQFPHPQRFGDDSFPLVIIDPFRSNQPILMNNDIVVNNRMIIKYIPQIILDSQILNYIDWYANDQSKLQGSKVEYVRRMLQYFVDNNYLYSAWFYYFEATMKGSSEQDLRINFSLFTKLLYLDKDSMLRNGIFSPNDKKFSELKLKLGLASLDDIVDYFIDHSREISSLLDDQLILIDIFYCIIIKIILIEKITPHFSLNDKLYLLKCFLSDIIQSQFSYELAIAICYFSGKLQRFLNIQKGMNYENATKSIIACSWDLLLLRQPDFLLAFYSKDIPIISTICTNDIALIEIANIYRLGCIINFIDDNIILSGHELNEDYLLGLIGDKIYSQISNILKLEKTTVFSKDIEKKIPVDELENLKNELENELKQFLQG